MIPETLFLSEVSQLSQHAETGGGFGDIYYGRFDGQLVALKVSHFFTAMSPQELEEIKKVSRSSSF